MSRIEVCNPQKKIIVYFLFMACTTNRSIKLHASKKKIQKSDILITLFQKFSIFYIINIKQNGTRGGLNCSGPILSKLPLCPNFFGKKLSAIMYIVFSVLNLKLFSKKQKVSFVVKYE